MFKVFFNETKQIYFVKIKIIFFKNKNKKKALKCRIKYIFMSEWNNILVTLTLSLKIKKLLFFFK